MTAKEQAFKLRHYYAELLNLNTNDKLISECALISVECIIQSWDEDLYKNCGSSQYWQEVKQEIEKL